MNWKTFWSAFLTSQLLGVVVLLLPHPWPLFVGLVGGFCMSRFFPGDRESKTLGFVSGITFCLLWLVVLTMLNVQEMLPWSQ
jgi:hypothetical protein